MNRLRRETCTLPQHNLPSREREREGGGGREREGEREREKKTFLEQAAFWHGVKVV